MVGFLGVREALVLTGSNSPHKTLTQEVVETKRLERQDRWAYSLVVEPVVSPLCPAPYSIPLSLSSILGTIKLGGRHY